ncbi:AAA family ATPase [Candidatus Parcubacteria bacterium]|nr:AAA family ATPase [Candidatus Parcubacteria bacterium]
MAEDNTKEKKQEFQAVKCGNCGGSGKVDNKICVACKGLGVVFWFNNTLFYWGRKISAASIFENRMEKTVRAIINGVLFVFSLAGVLSLVFYVYNQGVENIITEQFWLEQNWQMTLFWVSAIAIMYLFYRIDKESTLTEKVKKRKFNKSVEVFLSENPWEEIANLPKKSKIDISKSFNIESIKAIEEAWRLADKFSHNKVMPLHILAALLFCPKINLLLARLGVKIEEVAKRANRLFNRLGSMDNNGNLNLSVKCKQNLFNAYYEAHKARKPQADAGDILLAIVKQDNIAREILYDLKIDLNKIRNVVEWIRVNDLLVNQSRQFRKSAIFKPKGGLDRAMTAAATPTLDHFSQDLTLLAKFGYLEPCVGRDHEIEEIFRAMEASRQSVILTGNPGVGKTNIIEGIARLMTAEDVPEIIQDKRLVSLSVARLVSGARPAEAQGRMMKIIDEICRSGNIILFVQDIQDMSGITSGSEESLDLSEVLAAEMSKGNFFCFATASSIDYSRYIENTALGNAMQKINISEPELNQAIQILEAKTGRIEYQNKVYFSYGAIEQAVKLSDRYIHDRFLPEKAIKIIEQSAVFTQKKKGYKAVVLGEDVAELVSQKVKIPLTKITEKEGEKLLKLEQEIHLRIVGQEEAVKMVSAALRRARAELRDINRPIANFLFLGPTGVGKTELAKTVAEVYFGAEDNMVRLDMSEYQESGSINKLIGSPPEKGGSGTGGYLTEAVRKNPFTLLLLDEIEKAHPDILNAFLQLMDDGRLTDGLGRTVNFTNVILIATSNAGTDFIQEKIKENWNIDDIREKLINEKIKSYFAPEFINRFDGVIVFKPLNMSEVSTIAKLLLKKVEQRLISKGINLRVPEDVVNELARRGFDPKFGARPLRRVIQENVDNTLANYLIKGKINRRDTVILEQDGKIRIEKAPKL